MNLEDLSRQKWQKNWSGPWTLLECYYYGRAYTKRLVETYGVGLHTAAFIFHQDKGENFLIDTEVQAFGLALGKKVEANIPMALAWGETAKRQGDKARAFMASIEGREITLDDYYALWDILFTFSDVVAPIKKIPDYLNKETLDVLLPIFAEVRVYGEPVYAESALFIKQLAEQISQKSGIPARLVTSMTEREFENFFTTGVHPEIATLEERKVLSVLLVRGGEELLLTGEEAQVFEKSITGASTETEIRGAVAYAGKAVGTVKVVINPADVASFDEPTVLVTGMTRPEYMHLFKSAVAVVTDAGGVLSHAAITARELKKPCIIGATNATQVLKDGDLVEVDAERGVVRIVERK